MKSATNANNEDQLTGAFNVLMTHIKRDLQKSIPVKVTKVSGDRKFVNVQPQILVVDSSGSTIKRNEIKGIPVVTAGAGDFLISFDIRVGDNGWIESSDRDISLFKQYYSESKPNTRRMHSYSDARFIPDIMTDFSIAKEDSKALVIQNRTNTVKIALDANEIRIRKDDVTFNITGDKVVSNAPGGYFFNGANITPAGDVVTASGVSVDKHPHSQGADSAGDGQKPVNPPTPTE